MESDDRKDNIIEILSDQIETIEGADVWKRRLCEEILPGL